jgi:hypothetical protein
MPKAGTVSTDAGGVAKTSYVFSAGTPDKKIERYTVNYSDTPGPVLFNDGRCMTVSPVGSEVTVATCRDPKLSSTSLNGGTVQSWKIVPAKGIGYNIQGKGHSLGDVCLQMDSTSGTVMALPCLDVKAQQWDLLDVANDPRNKQVRTADGMCMTVEDSLFHNNVVIRPCAKNDKSQVWKF